MSEFHYDKKAAKHAVDFIQKLCTHVKGELIGQPLKLQKWERTEIIEPLFGWKRKDGSRRYRYCWVEVPRKNGKTTLACSIALYLLFGDGEPGAEIYSAAAAREQAGISFSIAGQMIRQSKELMSNCEIWKNSITINGTNSFYKCLSSEAFTKHGINAHGIIFDEIHAQPDRELWDVLTTSIGSRRQPLIVAITTAGIMKKGHIAWELHQRAKQIKQGIIKDDQFLPVIYQADSTDDPFAESTWKKCNPNYGISLKKQYLQDEAAKAKNQPTYLNTFKRLHLNVWTSSEKQYIQDSDWQKCNQKKIDETFFYGKNCILSFDLSATKDFTALCIGANENGIYHILPIIYIPKKKAQSRNMRDQIEVWEREGYVTFVEGLSLDYEFVYEKINELSKRCTIQNILYDRWNKSWLVNKLQGDDAPLKDFGQGYKSMSPALKEFEKLIMDKKINHGGNPVLQWMNSNMAITEDAAGNIKPDKAKSTEKIDGMIAAIMCLAGMIEQPKENPESIYEQRGILTI